MAAEVIADQQLMPQPREAFTSPLAAPAGQPYEPERLRQAAGAAWPWILALVLLPVLSSLSLLVFSALWAARSHKTLDVRSSARKVLSAHALVPAPVTARTGELIDAEFTPNTTAFEVMVEPDQTLRSIAVQYLGSSDLEHLHQIQILNPKLIDPNHIEAGQKIRLPGPPATPMAENAIPPANVRTLP
jgi:hypothetical protein